MKDDEQKINIHDFMKDNPFDISRKLKSTPSIVNYEAFHQNRTKELFDTINSHNVNKIKRENAKIAREEKQIELLGEIKDNTGSLVNIVDMIHFNSDQQTEILSIIADIMVLGTFDDKTEAESSFRKIMNNINQKIEDTESMIKLSDVAKMTWAYVKITYFGE